MKMSILRRPSLLSRDDKNVDEKTRKPRRLKTQKPRWCSETRKKRVLILRLERVSRQLSL